MEISESELNELRQTANKLLDLADRLEGQSVDVPEAIALMVANKLIDRICLGCGQKVPENERYRRGLDDACYGTTRNRIRRGEIRERDLMLAGKLTSEKRRSPGRPAKMDIAASAVAAGEVVVREARKKAQSKKKGQ